MKDEFCCDRMHYYATTPKEEHELIKYHAESRDYHFILHGHDLGMEQEMYYCPWCGSKLPDSLAEEWCKVAKEELGIDEVFAEQWETLPEEYKTDKWWKKRGL